MDVVFFAFADGLIKKGLTSKTCMHNVLQPVFGHNDPGDSTWMTIKDTVKTGAELFLANNAQIDLAEIAQNEVHIDEPAATTVKGTHMLSASRYTYSLH